MDGLQIGGRSTARPSDTQIKDRISAILATEMVIPRAEAQELLDANSPETLWRAPYNYVACDVEGNWHSDSDYNHCALKAALPHMAEFDYRTLDNRPAFYRVI